MATIIDLPVKEEVVEQSATVTPMEEISTKKVSALLTLDETVSGEKLAARLRAIAELVNDDETYTINMTLER